MRCSGLVRLAVYESTGKDLYSPAPNADGSMGKDSSTNGMLRSKELSNPNTQIWTGAPRNVDPGSLGAQPGDLLFYGKSASPTAPNTHHVAIYVGNGVIIEAPQSGEVISMNLWTPHDDLVGIRRVS
ncbi:NlpC/P60 family protein [Gordonia sp. CPCC 205333]|uniref:NlpC/P60 family protein n=1 Tax=Gordonia sp. CPCC 205333 TaxID=3140790 RepID=UPI003AF3A59C